MKVLITAGPTREPIDPVRYLSNRSSGKMGFALAAAALAQGHEVVLISGPVHLAPPEGAARFQVETAREMFEAVQREIPSCDIALFAAAVADYRLAAPATQKIKKHDATLTLKLERTEDILGSARSLFGFTGYLVGFAAETENLVANAQSKLQRKNVDLIVANNVADAGVGFGHETNAVTLVSIGTEPVVVGLTDKRSIAKSVLDAVVSIRSRSTH